MCPNPCLVVHVNTYPVHDHAADLQDGHVGLLALVTFPHNGAHPLQAGVGAVQPGNVTLMRKKRINHANVWMSDVTSSPLEMLRSQTWWKGSSRYSFLAGGQTGVPPPSPSGRKTVSVFVVQQTKKKKNSICCRAKLLTRLRRAGRPALGAVKEVLPQQVLRLGLVPGALRIVGPQAGTPGTAAGARLGDVLKVTERFGTLICF